MLNLIDTSEMILALASCDIVKDVTVTYMKQVFSRSLPKFVRKKLRYVVIATFPRVDK